MYNFQPSHISNRYSYSWNVFD